MKSAFLEKNNQFQFPNIWVSSSRTLTVSHHLWTCPRRDTFWSGSAGTGFGSCAWWDTSHSSHTSCSEYSAECCVWRNPGEGTRGGKKKLFQRYSLCQCACTQSARSTYVEHNLSSVVSPCSLRTRGRRNGTQMRCPRIPYTEAPCLQSLRRGTRSSLSRARGGNAITGCSQVNREHNRVEGCNLELTGECASQTTRSLSHCWVVVGCRWHRCYLGNGGIVYFRKLKDHSRGRISSPLLSPLLQGPNFLKGDTLWRWRLRVGGGRLGLVSAWGAARARAGTARWASIQDNTTWRRREGLKVSSPSLDCSHLEVRRAKVQVSENAPLRFREPTWQTLTSRSCCEKQRCYPMNNFQEMSQLEQQQAWPEYLYTGFWWDNHFFFFLKPASGCVAVKEGWHTLDAL